MLFKMRVLSGGPLAYGFLLGSFVDPYSDVIRSGNGQDVERYDMAEEGSMRLRGGPVKY